MMRRPAAHNMPAHNTFLNTTSLDALPINTSHVSTTFIATSATTQTGSFARAAVLLLLCGFAFAASCPAQWHQAKRRAKRSSYSSAHLIAQVAPASSAVAPTKNVEPASTVAPVNSDTQVVTPATDAAAGEARPLREDERLTFMDETVGGEPQEAPSAGGLLLRTLGALLLIVSLIAGVGYGLRRFGGARFGQASEDAPALAVLNSVALGDRRSIAVVRYGGRTLLVGSTQQSITLLADSDQDLDVETLSQPGARSVADMLDRDDASSAPRVAPSFRREMTAADARLPRRAPAIGQASDYKGGAS